MMRRNNERNSGAQQAPYAGEDTRSTTTKELSGWYSYGWAAEVFVVCGVGSFIPMTLEQLARERGVLLSDGITPCTATTAPGGNSTSTAEAVVVDPGNGQCVVNILGAQINTASFAMYTFSISVLFQALVIISMSGAADHGRFRKTLLLAFAFIGSIATMLFLPVVPSIYILAALLAIVANLCFGASFVLLNSFLPILVRHHPSLQDPALETFPRVSVILTDDQSLEQVNQGDPANLEDLADSTAALLPARGRYSRPPKDYNAALVLPELQLSTQISSRGIGIGYISAIVVQTFAIVLVVFTQARSTSSTLPLRLVLFAIGIWWFFFTIPAALWLRPRPGPPLSFAIATKQNNFRKCLIYVWYAWRTLGRTVLRAGRLRDLMLFLGAWFLLSDAIATVSGTAVLFAKTTLGMKTEALALINVVSMASGIIGAFTWTKISRMAGLKPGQTILACVCLFEIIPLYGLLGYLPFIQRLGVFGLQKPWEMYPLGAVYGFVLGGLSSYCRSLFGELIPPGSEAAFFALYSVTDKGSSIFGPAIVGAITDASGEIRPAFWFLAVLIGLPVPLLWIVNVERGKREAVALANEIAGRDALAGGSDTATR